MKYKALILDLDGTVVPSRRDGMPTERVKHAVRKASQHVKVCVASGRPYDLCVHILQALEITDPCVVDGGAEIRDPKNGSFLFRRYIPPQAQRQVLKVCQRFNIPLASSEDQYGSNLLKNPDRIKGPVAKLFIDAVSNQTAIELLEELESIEGVAPHLASSWQSGDVVDIHITEAQATKKHGVEELIRILGIQKSEVIGVGDHHNDLPMLESVGLKVVMGNAPEEVKAAADFVAPSLQDDGVAAVIEQFILG